MRVPFELRNYAVLLSLLRVDPAGAWVDYRLAKQARALGGMQKWRELAPLIGMLRNRRLATVVEIGTARGGTLWLWCRLADPHALIVSIDLEAEGALRAYGGRLQKVHLLSSDSHSAATRQTLVDILQRRPIDMLMIDGDHTYEGVKQDFEMYSPLVPQGGLVVLHDIVHPLHLESCRVDEFWGEIKQHYQYYEIKERSGGRTWEQWGGFRRACPKQHRGRGLRLFPLADVGLLAPVEKEDVMLRTRVCVAALAVGLVTAAAAEAAVPSLTLTPSSVKRGHSVLIKGSADGCAVGNTVFILSRAFVHTHEFAGVSAVLAKVKAGGAFRVTTRIPAARRPGRYGVTARCAGGNLGVLKHLTVRR